MNIRTLTRSTSSDLTAAVSAAARDRGLSNVFNPSVVIEGDVTYIAVRAETSPGERPFRALLLTVRDGRVDDVVDLSAGLRSVTDAKAADPKLVRMGAEIYVTFNTGKTASGENDIYLQRIAPVLGPPQQCIVHDRRRIEKNWGFYLLPDGVPRFIYSIAPLTLLRLSDGELGSSPTLTFTPELTAPMPADFPRLHIGSQPLMSAEGRALVAANRQVQLRVSRHKFYFGLIAEIDLVSGSLVRLSRHPLIHSWGSMLPPQREPHNPGLWSATYFSGLDRDGDDLVLSYGVNDREGHVARIAERSVWR